jgi:hypothetical protein
MIPKRDLFATYVRDYAQAHTRWNSPHAFQTLHLEDGQLRPYTHAVLMQDIEPGDYSKYMLSVVASELKETPHDPPYACLLLAEGYGVIPPGPGSSPEEREAYRRADLTRTFHLHPDAREMAVVTCADIYGRVWRALKHRDHPDEVREEFFPPGQAFPDESITTILAVATNIGVVAHGLPGTRQRMWN